MDKQPQASSQPGPSPPLDILILAAGLGTRMRSQTAKVLHKLGGRPLVAHVGSNSTLLVLSGDVPLVRAETLGALVHQHRTHRGRGAACTLMAVRLEDPAGYGRVLRDDEGRFQRIVEQKDATPEERQINEVNVGIYCFETRLLFPALERVRPENAQGEFYLTDVPAILRADGEDVSVFLHAAAREVYGVNTRAELSEFERILRLRTLRSLMLNSGVTVIDPQHTYVSPDAQIGRDTTLHPTVHVEGNPTIGEGCEIMQGTRIADSRVGNGVTVKDHCVIVESDIADHCTVGPFAHLRMNARMEEGSTVGNFIAVKKSRLGSKSKAMPLTYLGDADVGERTNIGAGTVTCNYDGKQKHQTTIESDVKIGSDTMLVSPVRIGARAVTGAGSVVTEDVPPDTLVAGVPAKVKKKLARDDESKGVDSSPPEADRQNQPAEVAVSD